MSFYARLEGSIKYESRDALEAVLQRLVDGGWMNDDHIWLVEGESAKYDTPNPTVTFETNTLRIPRDHYRNLARIESDLLADAADGTIVGSSTDGTFIGWVTTTEGSNEVRLREWAEERGYELKTHEDGPEEFAQWQNRIMDDWHEEHSDYPLHH